MLEQSGARRFVYWRLTQLVTRRRRATFTLPLILILALSLRLEFAWSYVHPRPAHALGAIPFLQESGNIAFSLVTGEGFSSPFRVETGPTAWTSPIYPLLLAGIFRLFGVYTFHAFLAAMLFNVLCSTLTCIPIFLAGDAMAGWSIGAAAASLWGIFPNAIILSVESMWDQSLAALLAALLLWATLILPGSRRWLSWCGYGALWGLALMTNPALLSLLPFLLGWLIFREGRWARAAMALAVAALCCVPWTVRNYLVFHEFVPLRNALGLSLWIGNNEHAEDWPVGRMHPISSTAEREKYIALGETAYMQEKREEAFRFMRTHPATDVRFIRDRFVEFWSGGTPHPLADFLRFRSVEYRFILLFNLAVAAGAFAGVVWLFRMRSLYAVPLAAYVIVFPCAYYLTLAIPRYRHPIDPAVLLLTSMALGAAWRLTKKARPAA